MGKKSTGRAPIRCPMVTTSCRPASSRTPVTYLEMMSPPVHKTRPSPPVGIRLERLTAKDAARFLELLSRDRRNVALGGPSGEKRQADHAASRRSGARGFREPSRARNDIALLQLQYDDKGNAEVVYFGVVSGVIGTGVGRWLMPEAIARAFCQAGPAAMAAYVQFRSSEGLALLSICRLSDLRNRFRDHG